MAFELSGGNVLHSGLLALVVAQVSKIFSTRFQEGRWDWKAAYGSGGMARAPWREAARGISVPPPPPPLPRLVITLCAPWLRARSRPHTPRSWRRPPWRSDFKRVRHPAATACGGPAPGRARAERWGPTHGAHARAPLPSRKRHNIGRFQGLPLRPLARGLLGSECQQPMLPPLPPPVHAGECLTASCWAAPSRLAHAPGWPNTRF